MWRAHVPHGERERSDALRAFLVYGVVLLGFAVRCVVRDLPLHHVVQLVSMLRWLVSAIDLFGRFRRVVTVS